MIKISAEALDPVTAIESRRAATRVLQATWLKMEELEKEFLKTGRVDLQVQLEHMKKQCLEIMENVRRNSSDI